MKKKKQGTICQSLLSDKTYVLVVEEDGLSKSSSVLNILQDFETVHVDIVEKASKSVIPNHDLYVINTNGLSYAKQLKMIKSVYKANPRAALFLMGNPNQETIDKINKDVQGLTDPTKLGEVIQGIVRSEADLPVIKEYVASVEDTKKRLASLWFKLDEADKKLREAQLSQ